LVAIDGDNHQIAQRLGFPQQVNVSPMEQVEAAVGKKLQFFHLFSLRQ